MPIALEGVSHTYPSHAGDAVPSLRDVSLQIGDGDFVGVMGRTGSGKTTLLQLVVGLLSPSAGRVLLDGQDINGKDYDRRVLRRNVGLVFQYPEYQLFSSTVEKDVAFGLKHSGLAPRETAERVKWALEVMGFSFDKIRALPPLALSGGEKRRVALAGVLVCKPRFLLFDEPIAGLDPMNRQTFLQLISRLNSEGTTILMVSHNADALGEYARRLLVFDRGALVMDNTAQEVFSDLDRLRALRLSAGTPRILGEALSRRGVAVPETATSYADLLEALKSRLKGDFSK